MVLTAKGLTGQVAFDGEWLTIIRSGFTAAMIMGGVGDVRVHVSQVTGIEYKKPGFSNGRFTVVAPGGVERSVGRKAHEKDPLTVEFTPRHQDAFLAIRGAVEGAISASRQAPAPTPVAPVFDPVAQLAQLGQMFQQGLLSPEEFTAAKANLIGPARSQAY